MGPTLLYRSLTPKDLEKCPNAHPLCDGRFFRLLEESGVIGDSRGWRPISFIRQTEEETAASYAYLKDHSFGEFIFDWAWADLYRRQGKAYYPKLIHALPFTPVGAPKLLASRDDLRNALIDDAFDYYQNTKEISGHHYLFTSKKENELLNERGYFIQKTFQYHWRNEWKSFDDFLSSLKSRKRKQLRNEREMAHKSSLTIERKRAKDLNSKEIRRIYELYMATIEKKNSLAYLNSAFFEKLPAYFPQDATLVFAKENGEIIAMSLFFHSDMTLYGRYWGIEAVAEGKYPFLHFELCYYRGMEICFEQGLERFEAGAQGEHKLLRGFLPTFTTSAHHLRDSPYNEIIRRHVQAQNQYIEEIIPRLESHLPYKLKQG